MCGTASHAIAWCASIVARQTILAWKVWGLERWRAEAERSAEAQRKEKQVRQATCMLLYAGVECLSCSAVCRSEMPILQYHMQE